MPFVCQRRFWCVLPGQRVTIFGRFPGVLSTPAHMGQIESAISGGDFHVRYLTWEGGRLGGNLGQPSVGKCSTPATPVPYIGAYS